MKVENNIEWFEIDSEEDGELLKLCMMDNGYWEYSRVGIGEDNKGVFIIDMEDNGMEWRGMNRVKEGLSVDDICKIGVECKVFEELSDDEGYGVDDKYRVREECERDDWEMFNERVLVSGEWINDY